MAAIQSQQEEQPLPETELVQCIWQGLMASVDWSARPDQIEGLALREVGVCFPPFSLNHSRLISTIYGRNMPLC